MKGEKVVRVEFIVEQANARLSLSLQHSTTAFSRIAMCIIKDSCLHFAGLVKGFESL